MRALRPASADHVLQHLAVEAEVGNQLPQLRVLVLELLQPPHLRRRHALELLLPIEVEPALGLDPRVAGLIPVFRQMSATGTPSAPCFRMNAFWASESCEAFIGSSPPSQGNQAPEDSNLECSNSTGADQASWCPTSTRRTPPAGSSIRSATRVRRITPTRSSQRWWSP